MRLDSRSIGRSQGQPFVCSRTVLMHLQTLSGRCLTFRINREDLVSELFLNSHIFYVSIHRCGLALLFSTHLHLYSQKLIWVILV